MEMKMPQPPPPRVRKPARPATFGIRLGSVAGVQIGIDLSWLIIVALLLTSLTSVFAHEFPNLPLQYYWAAAAVASAFFFVSILVHELAHSLVARRMGINVEGITLFVFGGVSRIKGEPQSPGQEFLIAGVGPLTSAAIGAGFLLLSLIFTPGSLAAGVVLWLGQINIALAVFNLLPGFPLDGGRLFRAVAWGISGSLKTATRLAAIGGMTLAYGLIFLGIVFAFGFGQLLNGVWLAFIGWFLLSAVQQTRRQVEFHEILGGLLVEQAMRTECSPIPPDESIESLIHGRVLKTGQRCFLVADGTTLLGLVTLHEIKEVPQADWPLTRVGNVMTRMEDLASIAPSDSLLKAIEMMDESSVNQLPVVTDSTLVGVLTREDVLRMLTVHLELKGRGESGPRAPGGPAA